MASNSSHENFWTRGMHRTSRRGLIRGAGIVGAGLTGAALIGCGDDDEPEATPAPTAPGASTPAPSGATPSGDGPRQGGELGTITGTTPVQNFNPVTNWHDGHVLSGFHTYDRLFSPRLDERGWVLEAAESVEIPDDTTIIFHMKDGLVYQDKAPVNGRPVDAQDIVDMQLYTREATGAHNNSFQLNSMESVEAPDDRTVIFRLVRPNAYVFTSTQMGHPGNFSIVPRERLDDMDGIEPVGSGPYQLRELQWGARFIYERNPTFRKAAEDQPYIDQRIVLDLTDPSAQESAFRSEQAHVLIAPSAEFADRLIRDLGDRIEVEEYMDLGNFTTGMSAERPMWDDVRAREAYYRMLNKQQFVELVDNGRAVPAPGFLAVGLENYLVDEAETAEFWRHDPAEARQLLDAAGFDLNPTYELVTFTGNARLESAIQVLARQLQEVGIQTTIQLIQFSEYLGPVMNTGNFDIAINTHPAFDSPQMQLRWHHTDPQTIISKMNLRDPDVDAMIEESEVTLDLEANIDLVKRIQIEILSRYARFIQLNTRTVQNLRWNYVRDWEINAATTHVMYRTEAWMDV
jgi:peptide/nickel transport system substrate-binding protein